MNADVDFARLGLQDALDLAILVEDEAQERYLELADQMEQHHTAEAAKFFRTMAGNEKKHGDDLRARRRSLFGDTPRRVTSAMLWDVEAPGYDDVRLYMSARQAMETALRSEVKAHAFFVEALPHLADAEVRALFEELRDEEVLHQSLVRESLRALGPERPVDPADYEDPPVAQ